MSKKILIIEDEPGLRLTLSDRLRSEGYEVDTASDGLEGEAKASSGSFDVILLDVMKCGITTPLRPRARSTCTSLG